VGHVRTSKRPYFLEALTYRFLGHSMADPSHGHYRTKSEVDEAKKRDPLILLKSTLLGERGAAEADFKTLEQEVKEIVDEAVDFAEASPALSLEALGEDVYTGEQGGSHGTNGPSRRARGGPGAIDAQSGRVPGEKGGSWPAQGGRVQ
jgi:TPP-dependent pyruvate/acetoin dehydrogenase alpha subunit